MANAWWAAGRAKSIGDAYLDSRLQPCYARHQTAHAYSYKKLFKIK